MASLSHWRRQLNSGLLFGPVVREILSLEHIEEQCRRAGHQWRDSFWSPSVTLLTFLLQVLSGEKTLRSAVAALLTQLAARGIEHRPSVDPSAYCQARRRLPLGVVGQLSDELASRMQTQVSEEYRWHGHRIVKVDGTTVSMPDTPGLQKAFPQPETQKPGCGFPIARLVVLFSWATGAVIREVAGNLHVAENNLFRAHYADWIESGDVVLADRHYCSYVDLARLSAQGVFVVYRLHQRRPADFRTGRKLGRNDRLVTWRRPELWLPSFGISREDFERLPETLTVRIIRISHVPKGFRSHTVVVVTTLLAPVAYPAAEIGGLYRDRWTVELNLRSLKTHLGMDILRGQSEDVVRKEIAVHLLDYNLIRLLMWRAAREHARNLHRLSFTGTLHRVRQLAPSMLLAPDRNDGRMLTALLAWIASDLVPDRPNRIEPRRKKRRPKEYSLLNKPRRWYHLHGDIGAR
jgi:hypothetical protein